MKLAWILGLWGSLLLTALVGRAYGQAGDKAGWTGEVPRVPGARYHFVAPGGRAENPGTEGSPWDLESALGGKQEIAPGDVIWVRGGVYRAAKEAKFETRLSGTARAPIIVRGHPGERANLLDCGIVLSSTAEHVWVWDLEIRGSAVQHSKQTGPFPDDILRYSPFHAYGPNCKAINLIIHDNPGGGGSSISAVNHEFHGCIIYNNGWIAPDRGHGHCLYLQSKDGLQRVTGCILNVPPHDGSYVIHAYGSGRTPVINIRFEETIAYGGGTFLVGGEAPSSNIQVIRNYLYEVGMQIGYTARNEDCELRDNVVARAGLMIVNFDRVVDEGNTRGLPGSKAVLIPNRYDPHRAHVAVYNGAKAPEVALKVAPFLKPGEKFRLMKPKDLHGKPIIEGTCTGETARIPMDGEFVALVLLK